MSATDGTRNRGPGNAVGHRRLAALVPSGPLEEVGRHRSEGLRKAALDTGADSEEILLEATPESAERATGLSCARGPSAVFTYNDEYGALMHGVLTDLGVTFPDDLALVGADDLPIARYLRPTLSSVAIDATGLAGPLFTHLQAVLNGPTEDAKPLEGLAPPRVVHRGTS
ncbi:substrate-binding domain-containing protein [Streptomyces sp. NPDC051064]|uniref:substrate-binding domain-containing protein n=1 Tax=Streptomyces sp. NPDC051064 TaxID=3365641 RepID=UPI003791246B